MPLRPVIDQAPHITPIDPLSIAVFVLFFIAALLLTRRRAAFGLAILIVTDPFAFYRDVAHTTITLPKIALVAVVIGLIWNRASPALVWDWRIRPLLLAICAVALTTALSIAQADFIAPAIRETLKALQYVALFVTAVVAYAHDPDRRLIRAALLATVGVVALLALSQELLGAPSGMWFNGHPIPRIAGPLEGPNQLSGYFGIALPLVLIFALIDADAPSLLVLALVSCADVLTLSRAGVVSAAISIATVAFIARRAQWRPAFASMSAGITLGLAVDAAWSFITAHSSGGIARFGSIAQVAHPGAVGTRSQLWHAAFSLWKQHPLFGIGAGNFELEIARVGPPNVRTHANNGYLQALTEGGLPLFLATLAATVISIRSFLGATLGTPFALGALAASIGLAFHEVFDFLVFYPKVGGWWWIVLGIGAAELVAGAREYDRF